MEKSLEEIIELSKKNNGFYTSDKGVVIYKGEVYKDKETLERTIKLTIKIYRFFEKLKSFFFFWR